MLYRSCGLWPPRVRCGRRQHCCNATNSFMGGSISGLPPNGWFLMEHPIKKGSFGGIPNLRNIQTRTIAPCNQLHIFTYARIRKYFWVKPRDRWQMLTWLLRTNTGWRQFWHLGMTQSSPNMEVFFCIQKSWWLSHPIHRDPPGISPDIEKSWISSRETDSWWDHPWSPMGVTMVTETSRHGECWNVQDRAG